MTVMFELFYPFIKEFTIYQPTCTALMFATVIIEGAYVVILFMDHLLFISNKCCSSYKIEILKKLVQLIKVSVFLSLSPWYHYS